MKLLERPRVSQIMEEPVLANEGMYSEEDPMATEHQAIKKLAYEYWEERGRPEGSAQEDWLRAEADYEASRRDTSI